MSGPTDPGERVLPPTSPPISHPRPLRADADALLDHLAGPGWEALQGAGVGRRLRALSVAAGRLSDPSDRLRQEAESRLPSDAVLSPEAARAVIDGMARDWTGERLEAAVRADFPDPAALDGFVPAPLGEHVRAVPPRLLVQVGAGNVPGTGATALIRALLVGAPTVLKPGSGDGVLPALLARALAEEDPALAEGVAVLPWEGGRGGEIEARAFERADRVVVYGGADAVAAIRGRVGPLTPVVVYGPRVSAGVVLREALGGDRSGAVAGSAARAVAAYEQRGCVSPHAIWVEQGGGTTPREWASLLAEALEGAAAELPAPPPDPELAGAMRQLRDAAEVAGAAGRETWVGGGPDRGWMVLYSEDPAFEPSCLGRTVRVLAVGDASELPGLVAPAHGLLQSLAVEGSRARRTALGDAVAVHGVSRITTFAAQPWPPAWWRHDGEGPLRRLVSWTTLEAE